MCFVQASEEEMAEVEAATKQLLDTRGGTFSPFYLIFKMEAILFVMVLLPLVFIIRIAISFMVY